MTLEQLVPTLEVCRQLRDKGFPQDAAMVWVIPIGVMGLPIPYVARSSDSINHHFKCVAAPTAGELEEWLLCHDCDNITVTNESADGENAVGISCIHSDGRYFEADEANEVDAKASLVLEVMK